MAFLSYDAWEELGVYQRSLSFQLDEYRRRKYQYGRKQLADYVGVNHAVALSCGTAALHLAVKLAAERLYGTPRAGNGILLQGVKVFCSDMTFDATVNPIAYEGGEAVFY